MSEDAAQRADDLVERARQEVFAICKGRHGGGHEWRMSIPVNEERDSDCIIMAGLNALDAAVAEAVKEREIADAHAWNRRLTGGISSLLDPQRLIEMHDRRVADEARREERQRAIELVELMICKRNVVGYDICDFCGGKEIRWPAHHPECEHGQLLAALSVPPASASEGTYPKPAKIVGRPERASLT